MLIYTAMKKTVTIYSSHDDGGADPPVSVDIYTRVAATSPTLSVYDEGSPEVLFRTSIYLSPARLVRNAASSVIT